MSRSRAAPRDRGRKHETLADVPIHVLVEKNPELRELRTHHAVLPAEERREAAQWAYDSACASMLMAQVTKEADLVRPAWLEVPIPLAIDPEYAPAMLTVGSLEYQYGRVREAMLLFLKLITCPADTEDLHEIIGKAGDFLMDQGDYVNASQLYASAVQAYPHIAEHHVGQGICAMKRGMIMESVAHNRRAVKLEPNSYRHLNDLGYSLLETMQFDEAEEVLQRAMQLAPRDFDLPKANLDYLRKVRTASLRNGSRKQEDDERRQYVVQMPELDSRLCWKVWFTDRFGRKSQHETRRYQPGGSNPRPACSDDGPAPEMSIIFTLQRERKFELMLHAGMYCSGKKSKQFSELDHGRDRRCKSR